MSGERSSRPLILLDNLFESPVLSIPQAQAVLGTTYRGAMLNAQKLTGHGVLRRLGDETYGKLYIADAIMEILRGGAA